jgi:SAM-dependent MidA family methyltransferase
MSTSPLQSIILAEIAHSPEQRISFARFMDLALYHPIYGYYSSGRCLIGSQGDFFTSLSLGADFAELWAEQFHQIASIFGFPTGFSLLEVGAGLGYFAQDTLNYFQKQYPVFYESLNYIIVEVSPTLQDKQKQILETHLERVSWKSWQEITDNSLLGCVFSNELIDALPTHLLTLYQGDLKEIYIAENQDKLIEINGEISTKKIRKYLDFLEVDINSKTYPEGYRTEVNLEALNWLDLVTRKLQKGYIITVDYGYTSDRYYHPQRYEGTLQCYYQHQRHNNPYLYLGEQDITTHVNFTALEKYGEKLGLQSAGWSKQGMVLMALGLGERLLELSSGKYNLEQILQRRDALHQLIDPAGLGNFGVLIQSKGLSLEEAQASLKALQQF